MIKIEKLNLIKTVILDNVFKRNALPLMYYAGDNNFGDVLGLKVFESVANRECKRCTDKSKKHFQFLGSILAAGNANTAIFGSGLIKESETAEIGYLGFIRGKLSLNKTSYRDSALKEPLLGDALTVLTSQAVRNKFEISNGLDKKTTNKIQMTDLVCILHHTTYLKLFGSKSLYTYLNNSLIISTLYDWKSIYRIIQTSQFILSDALHPLILSDILSTPSCRLRLNSSGLIGGEFKFNDYNSSCKDTNRQIINFSNINELSDLIASASTIRFGGNILFDNGDLMNDIILNATKS